ncbi:uncharacterized protein LOC104585350 [Brachypodium distachyon]|uniref:Uncharacterized protein n=1 Tax=Brachypodium distachyon TaxID=15368 RepID=A0A2K2CGS8_BRADI|nr:uncharacterized protein LOC104585350 [Brachypodium distachyon]PNT61225.1 hypothetical protein BRADI_5g12296v3 [Brachypodium distachyon]|eukprot:XP_010239986.1 uncharacterized protein LOC104585350 [Brachypodium distachyon]
MGSIQRQDSFDSDRLYLSDDDLREAPTLTSKQMEEARAEARRIMETHTPEEAFKIFTNGLEYPVANPPGRAVAVKDKAGAPSNPGGAKKPQPPPKN